MASCPSCTSEDASKDRYRAQCGALPLRAAEPDRKTKKVFAGTGLGVAMGQGYSIVTRVDGISDRGR